MSTLEKVKKVVVDQLSVDESLVTPEASFIVFRNDTIDVC